MLGLGVRIRAWLATELGNFQAYRQPMPLKRKQFSMAGEGPGMYRTVIIDPEDNPEEQEDEPVTPRRRRVLAC